MADVSALNRLKQKLKDNCFDAEGKPVGSYGTMEIHMNTHQGACLLREIETMEKAARKWKSSAQNHKNKTERGF